MLPSATTTTLLIQLKVNNTIIEKYATSQYEPFYHKYTRNFLKELNSSITPNEILTNLNNINKKIIELKSPSISTNIIFFV